jgi:hypothetical protein
VEGRWSHHQNLLKTGLSVVTPKEAELKNLTCLTEGLHPTVAVRRFGAALDVTCLALIESLVINADQQEMTLLVKELGVTGTNWLGWLIAPLSTFILRRIYGKKLVEFGHEANVQVRPHPLNHHRFTVGLENLPQVRKLKETSVSGRSLLTFVQISGCRHAEGGLHLRGAVTIGL